MSRTSFDIAVVGAGIAGASAAWRLARERASVVVLERESRPAYHASSRSVTMFAKTYGGPVMQALAAAGEAFFRAPPDGFTEQPLLQARPMLHVARSDQEERLDAFERSLSGLDVDVAHLDAASCIAAFPPLRDGYAAAGLLDRDAAAIDDAALIQGYVRGLKRRGGELRTDWPVERIERTNGAWRLRSGEREVEAAILVNAAGAWADPVAGLAGLGPLGLQPLRRTAAVIDPPGGADPADWPMLICIEESFYARPDAGRLIVSPADETPSEPVDAQPDDLDVAIGIDRWTQATGHEPRRVHATWAGLRTFAADHMPVVGRDPREPTFVWLAGQGGAGFMTAPGLAEALAASLAGRRWADGPPPDAIGPARLLR